MGKEEGIEIGEIIQRKGRAESQDEANGADPLWCAWVEKRQDEGCKKEVAGKAQKRVRESPRERGEGRGQSERGRGRAATTMREVKL